MTGLISPKTPMSKSRFFTWDRVEQVGQEQLIKETISEFFLILALARQLLFWRFHMCLGRIHLVNLLFMSLQESFYTGFDDVTFNLPSLREKYGPISYKVALFSSLIFISHPIQTQSVPISCKGWPVWPGCSISFPCSSVSRKINNRSTPDSLLWRNGVELFAWGFSKENVAILPLFMLSMSSIFFRI